MGILLDKIKKDSEKNGIVNYFKDNSLYFYNQFQSPSNKSIEVINTSKIEEGKFYFLYYYDDSKWMQYAPIFVVDFKKIDNKIIVYAINFNFLPIQIKSAFFDKYIKDLTNDKQFTSITFETVYTQLLRIGYEYSLMEFNVKMINRVYDISIDLLPQFLNFSHPLVKYDPNKLYDIWVKKLKTKQQRHQEMIQSTVSDFYNFSDEMNEKYTALNDHMKRIEKNSNKYNT